MTFVTTQPLRRLGQHSPRGRRICRLQGPSAVSSLSNGMNSQTSSGHLQQEPHFTSQGLWNLTPLARHRCDRNARPAAELEKPHGWLGE